MLLLPSIKTIDNASDVSALYAAATTYSILKTLQLDLSHPAVARYWPRVKPLFNCIFIEITKIKKE